MQYRLATVLLSTFVISACTTITDLPLGTPLSAIEQQFGSPTVACPTQDPTRFVWSGQPYGQYAWAVDVNSAQQLEQASQVLSDSNFNLLSDGIWDMERVHCYFGPPANKDVTPYIGVKMRVWSYRYKQQGVWNSMMYVYFDDQGIVKHHHPGPDPLTTQDGSFFSGF